MKKIRLYKRIVLEIIETLCTICAVLGVKNPSYRMDLREHFITLKNLENELKGE